MDCIYCESGKTTDLTLKSREFYPTQEIIQELEDFLKSKPELDFITFSGAGEPLLHSGIGDIINFIVKEFPEYKTALLTNSMLLTNNEIANSILNIDLIVPSLDAALDDVFIKINRPVPGVKCADIIKALSDFKLKSKALFCLEILFIAGINDSEDSLNALLEAVSSIKPDKVQLNTLDRPGTETGIYALQKKDLSIIAELFLSKGFKVEIPGRCIQLPEKSEEGELYDILDRILALLLRRPSTLNDISKVLKCEESITVQKLKILESECKIISEIKNNIKFYKIL
jgi:wyosine [tRNA(Phe)-imidazoG37] synthetase (radical SAM superfamily)